MVNVRCVSPTASGVNIVKNILRLWPKRALRPEVGEIMASVEKELDDDCGFAEASPIHNRRMFLTMFTPEAVGETQRTLTMVEALRESAGRGNAPRFQSDFAGRRYWRAWRFRGRRLPLRSVWEKEFGHDRVLDTPISEAAIAGVRSGCSYGGLIRWLTFNMATFIFLAMDQLANQAAKMRYMSGGTPHRPHGFSRPGRSYTRGAQHGQSLEAFLMHVPGLKVVCHPILRWKRTA